MTKKYVLSGGPCSGKTTVINELKKRGFSVIDETAREVIKERINNEFSSEEICIRQKLILHKQLDKERSVEVEHVFLDRGLIDCFAYQNYFLKSIPEEFFEKSRSVDKYNKVFIFERLPLEKDGLRIENSDLEAEKIHQEIIIQYKNFGYDLIFVPIMEVEKRTDFVIDHMEV